LLVATSAGDVGGKAEPVLPVTKHEMNFGT
jgi:hypothetical protein